MRGPALRGGCSLGGMHALLAEALGDGLLDEVVELTRDLIRIDTANPPGHETLGAAVLAVRSSSARASSAS